jgi:coenzyme PQQ precursor peptide PqqA
VKPPKVNRIGSAGPNYQQRGEATMWTKPEAEIVAVTMEVTAYVATL